MRGARTATGTSVPGFPGEGKVRCSPSSPCSRARARCAWVRVAPLLSSPPPEIPAKHDQVGTGKPVHRSNRKAASMGRTASDCQLSVEQSRNTVNHHPGISVRDHPGHTGSSPRMTKRRFPAICDCPGGMGTGPGTGRTTLVRTPHQRWGWPTGGLVLLPWGWFRLGHPITKFLLRSHSPATHHPDDPSSANHPIPHKTPRHPRAHRGCSQRPRCPYRPRPAVRRDRRHPRCRPGIRYRRRGFRHRASPHYSAPDAARDAAGARAAGLSVRTGRQGA